MNQDKSNEPKKPLGNKYIYYLKRTTKILLLAGFLLYMVVTIAEIFYEKEILLYRSGIDESNIILEMNEESYEFRTDTTTIIYLKDNELGFIVTGSSDKYLDRFFHFGQNHGYSLFEKYRKYDINTVNGDITRIFKEEKFYLDKNARYQLKQNAKKDELQFIGNYSFVYYGVIDFKYYNIGLTADKKSISVPDDVEVSNKFTYYLEDAFDGVYLYYFETDERIEISDDYISIPYVHQ